MVRIRLDRALVERGLARSRAQAQGLVAAGRVIVDRAPAFSPARLVGPADHLEVIGGSWRPRGAVKLGHALDGFEVDPSGRVCLDVGASTGGFTMVLLERGARRVVAVDVGRGQLDPSLREDRRVRALERTDVRSLVWPLEEPASLVVVDVSFVSLAAILPSLLRHAGPGAEGVLLVKPQFEVGRAVASRYRGVIPLGPERDAAIEAVTGYCAASGIAVLARRPSELRGGDGNLEEFFHVRFPVNGAGSR